MSLEYEAFWVDESFSHEFGVEKRSGADFEEWYLVITSGNRTIRVSNEDIPEQLYDVFQDICAKDLAKNCLTRNEDLYDEEF